MVGVGVVKANNVYACRSRLLLRGDQVLRRNMVAVGGGVDMRVLAAHGGTDQTLALFHLAQQDSATLLRIRFFAVFADGIIVASRDLDHSSLPLSVEP